MCIICLFSKTSFFRIRSRRHAEYTLLSSYYNWVFENHSHSISMQQKCSQNVSHKLRNRNMVCIEAAHCWRRVKPSSTSNIKGNRNFAHSHPMSVSLNFTDAFIGRVGKRVQFHVTTSQG